MYLLIQSIFLDYFYVSALVELQKDIIDWRHSHFLGFLKVLPESEMYILFQNCRIDKFGFIVQSKIFPLIKRLENRFPFPI